MRSRGPAPQRETGTGTTTRPGTPGQTERDERHDPNGHLAHHPGSGLDAWIRELAEAAPPLTPAQRHTLALLLTSPASVPARPADAVVQDHQMP
jgi:predicted dehydrogenase